MGVPPPRGGCHPSLYSAFPLEVYLVAPFLLFFPQWRLGQDRYVVGSLCRRVWPSQTFWALSIQFMFRFEISEIPCAQWNGTFWLHRPNPSHCVFGYCSCKEDTKECTGDNKFVKWNGTFQSDRPTEITRPVKVDHLQSWSRIFQLDQTEMVHSIWCTNRNFWNFGLNGKRPVPLVGNRYDGPLLTDMPQCFFIIDFVRPRNV